MLFKPTLKVPLFSFQLVSETSRRNNDETLFQARKAQKIKRKYINLQVLPQKPHFSIGEW
jgi:hypothetical protein